MKRHKAELGHGEILFVNKGSLSNEALEMSQDGETVKECKREEDSSSEEEFSEEAKDLYQSKLRVSKGDPTRSQEGGGETETGEDGELYEPSTEDGEFKIDIKDNFKDIRLMFEYSDDDE